MRALPLILRGRLVQFGNGAIRKTLRGRFEDSPTAVAVAGTSFEVAVADAFRGLGLQVVVGPHPRAGNPHVPGKAARGGAAASGMRALGFLGKEPNNPK